MRVSNIRRGILIARYLARRKAHSNAIRDLLLVCLSLAEYFALGCVVRGWIRVRKNPTGEMKRQVVHECRSGVNNGEALCERGYTSLETIGNHAQGLILWKSGANKIASIAHRAHG